MKKTVMKLIFVSLLLVHAGIVFGAEMAKEGSASDTTYYTSTSQILEVGEGHAQINYDARGVITSDNEASPTHNASTQCVGATKVVRAAFKEFGYCISARPDGDKIYSSYEGTGKGGSVKGIFTFVGGTGKCIGMTGGGEWARTSLQGPAQGVGASISKGTYSWKIP